MKALIVVDYQNDFIIGSLGCERAKALEQPIIDKIEAYRKNGDMVVFTKDWHNAETYLQQQEGRRLPVVHCTDEKGRSLYGRVNDYCNDENTVRKDGFGAPDLPAKFAGKNIEEFELCGTFVTPCLMSNAIILKCFFPEARIVVDTKTTMAVDEDIGEKALDVMENMQIDIIRDKKAKDQVDFYKN